MLLVLFIPAIVSFIIVTINFGYFLIYGRLKSNRVLFGVVEVWVMLIAPATFLAFFDVGRQNDCCADSAIFSPEHRAGIYICISLSVLAYLTSMRKNSLLPPLTELFLNLFLILGLIINILLCVHLPTEEMDMALVLLGNVPIIMLILIRLAERQQLLLSQVRENEPFSGSGIDHLAFLLASFQPLIKYPILLIILFPVLMIISLFLMVFGQKPDTLIRSFTDTYKHGLSQLDFMCDNVTCGGHFLCSVGANGHKIVVKPKRIGYRHGNFIICNRQLLVANAFEELLHEKCPAAHASIRYAYNRVGTVIHRYYGIFDNRWISDIVYIAMKPVEWIFVVILYAVDHKPENRIHTQYLMKQDRKILVSFINERKNNH